MDNEQIIKLYKQGFSIDYITDKYYKSINSNFVVNCTDNYILIKKKTSKKTSRERVEAVLLDYLRKMLKGEN